MYNDIFNHRDLQMFFYPNKCISCNPRFEKNVRVWTLTVLKSRIDFVSSALDNDHDKEKIDLYRGETKARFVYI